MRVLNMSGEEVLYYVLNILGDEIANRTLAHLKYFADGGFEKSSEIHSQVQMLHSLQSRFYLYLTAVGESNV